MALSDCEKCWNTPCTCGYEYRKMGKTARIELAAVILGVDEVALEKLLDDFVPKRHPKHAD